MPSSKIASHQNIRRVPLVVIGVSFHRVVSGAEEAYRRGVTVQKGRTADRPYLTVAEEAANGDVAEVLPPQKCMPVPDGPPALIGLFGRSGRVVSVIDLALALGLEAASPEDENAHFILLRREQPQVALRVDRAYAVTDILPLTGEEAPGFRNDAVTGYGRAQSGPAEQDEIVSLLDIERFLRSFLPSSSVPGV